MDQVDPYVDITHTDVVDPYVDITHTDVVDPYKLYRSTWFVSCKDFDFLNSFLSLIFFNY